MDVNAPTPKFEAGQASLISSIEKVRESQQSIENKLADVNKRLVNAETKALKLDNGRANFKPRSALQMKPGKKMLFCARALTN